MNQMKRLLALALSLALSVTMFAGCSNQEGSSSSADASSSGSTSEVEEIQPMDLTGVTDIYLATAGISADTPVAKVGDYEITADSLLYWLNYNINYTLQQYSYMGVTEIPWDADANGKTAEQSLLDTALQLAAYYRILPEMGAQEGLSVSQTTQDAIQAEMGLIQEELGSEDLLRSYFWMQMMTPELYQEMCAAGDYNTMLLETYFGEGSEGYPTDAEVLAFAEEELGYYRAKHILLLTKDMNEQVTNEDGTVGYAPLDEETVAAKKALADDLYAQLEGASDPITLFDSLMNEHSEDSGLAAYPDGYTAYKGQMVPEFEETALALQDGEISQVVESDYGYHIILRLPLDPADYRSTLASKRMEEKSNQWLEELGVTTLDAYNQIDPSDYWDKVNSLTLAAYNEVQAALEAKAAEEESASSSSSAASSSAQG